MMGGLTLGPFSFPAGLLTAFAAIVAMVIVGERYGRKHGVQIERSLWLVIGIALLAARVVYVLRFAHVYMEAPLTILSIRDGGFSTAGGLAAGAACAAFLGWRKRHHLKPLWLAAGAGVTVFGLATVAGMVLPQRSPPLPQVAMERLEGGTLAFSGLVGKPVVVNLWASWCGPCRREMPVLRQAQLDHPEVTFIFVNQGESAETIRAYLTSQNLKLDNIVLDVRSQMGRALGSRALPTTFFFDAQGVLRGRRVGEVSAATLSEQLASQK